jgi:2-C-methyl-D-erythritol 2,4-cyclodiphosphate synthase
MTFRIGFGQDSHIFSNKPDRKLILGGYLLENEKGLEGDSDGDVAIHAICRAIEQALGNPDFHGYAGPMCKKGTKDSREYLKVALRNAQDAGFEVNNLGLSFECQEPKIAPIADKIKKILSIILKIEEAQIGINASTGDGMTAFGEGRGIQCFAIVSLIKKNEKN